MELPKVWAIPPNGKKEDYLAFGRCSGAEGSERRTGPGERRGGGIPAGAAWLRPGTGRPGSGCTPFPPSPLWGAPRGGRAANNNGGRRAAVAVYPSTITQNQFSVSFWDEPCASFWAVICQTWPLLDCAQTTPSPRSAVEA